MTNPLLTDSGLPDFRAIRPEHVEPAIDTLLADYQTGIDALLASSEPRNFESVMQVCERLDDGHVTGMDRSATAIARAEKRLWRHLENGLADLQHRDLAGFHGDGRPYDAVFAVNVNVFWAAPAEPEAARLRELVADDGVVRLFYELPGGVQDSRAADRTRSVLGHAGFATRVDVIDAILCVTGTPLPRAEP